MRKVNRGTSEPVFSQASAFLLISGRFRLFFRQPATAEHTPSLSLLCLSLFLFDVLKGSRSVIRGRWASSRQREMLHRGSPTWKAGSPQWVLVCVPGRGESSASGRTSGRFAGREASAESLALPLWLHVIEPGGFTGKM